MGMEMGEDEGGDGGDEERGERGKSGGGQWLDMLRSLARSNSASLLSHKN